MYIITKKNQVQRDDLHLSKSPKQCPKIRCQHGGDWNKFFSDIRDFTTLCTNEQKHSWQELDIKFDLRNWFSLECLQIGLEKARAHNLECSNPHAAKMVWVAILATCLKFAISVENILNVPFYVGARYN